MIEKLTVLYIFDIVICNTNVLLGRYTVNTIFIIGIFSGVIYWTNNYKHRYK